MAWECGECLGESKDMVCHHCGKPLCGEHAVVVVDDALSEHEGTLSERVLSDHAVHCEDCQKQHHPRPQIVRPMFERMTP